MRNSPSESGSVNNDEQLSLLRSELCMLRQTMKRTIKQYNEKFTLTDESPMNVPPLECTHTCPGGLVSITCSFSIVTAFKHTDNKFVHVTLQELPSAVVHVQRHFHLDEGNHVYTCTILMDMSQGTHTLRVLLHRDGKDGAIVFNNSDGPNNQTYIMIENVLV